jgi:glycosyltransferase involved in cell wall biosynthesis
LLYPFEEQTMRIAQIAPLAESVPPQLYGGTERVVAYLTDELVRQGHDVTLFASGDSQTAARLVPCVPHALRLDPNVWDALPHHLVMLDTVRQMASEFDVLHFHIDLMQHPLAPFFGVPHLTTLHGRLDLPDLQPFYRRFNEVPLVSISDAQRAPMPPVNWLRTIHHGLPPHLFSFGEGERGYLAFLGRISPEKRPDRAIRIAVEAGLPLKIAAKIDKVDRDYWTHQIEPLVRAHPSVEYVGELGERDKAAFLGAARALLFPIDWPEPFGLVMIEAMACGTPVVAFANGSVPEVVDHGTTGFLVANSDEACAALRRVGDLDRRAIRDVFERRFGVQRMADEYIELYARLQASSSAVPLSAEVLRLTA